ncbi:MAG: NFACT RNA binding domain-containing protein [Firmicutes bacterium]|nr:NFACT RNA binding domain-containing protein [Bacillota bacterium]
MDAPLLLALARARIAAGPASVQGLWVSPRALALTWAPERRIGWNAGLAWVFLLNPSPELWLLHEKDPALAALKAQSKTNLSRLWGAELKGARLEAVEGDPRERWICLHFRRRALTGRMEETRLAFQAIPGRGGLRLDGVDLNPVRLGLGAVFPAGPPEPGRGSPALERWQERFGGELDRALAGRCDDVLPGEGPLFERHRQWSQARAEALLLKPRQAQADRALAKERQRLVRYGDALAQDRRRHESALPLRLQAQVLSAELWRLKGAQGEVRRDDGTSMMLPVGMRAEEAVQHWFAQAKRAERGLARVAELEREQHRQMLELEARMGDPLAFDARPPAPKERKPMEKKPEKRADGKGKAFREVNVEGWAVVIGKGDADNDTLTFKVASPLDFWLHVAGVPGSHVILRNPDRISEPPREVLERAAQLAAFFSKARDGGKVEVHWCRVADVSKPRGFPPGKVMLKTFKSLRVYPKE